MQIIRKKIRMGNFYLFLGNANQQNAQVNVI